MTNPQAPIGDPVRTPRRAWIGLTVLVLPVILASMDLSVLYLAMPKLSADLAPGAGQALWIIDIYGFLLAGLLITMGNVGDRIGRRRLLIIGSVVFGVGSVAAAFAPSAETLIAARALMGVGGATLMPSTLSLIRSMFADDRDRTRAIAIWAGAFAGGSALGPVVGGVLLEHFFWGSVFLINVPIILLILAVIPVLVPEYRDPSPTRPDLLSVVLSMAALLPLVWAIKRVAEESAVDVASLGAAAVGIVSAIAFVRRQGRVDKPLVDLTLFTRSRFTGAVLGGTLAMFALSGVLFFLAQYLQLVEGFGPLGAALWNLPAMAAVGVGAGLAPVAAERMGRPAAFRTAFLVAAAGLGVLALASVGTSLAVLIVGSMLLGLGIATPMALATDIVVASAPEDRAGAASAISETGNELGGALGLAVMGSVGVGVYRAAVEDDLPAELSAEAGEAVSSTLAAALEAAGSLDPGVADRLVKAATDAFVDGMAASAVGGAAILVALAVVIPRMLRDR